MTEQSSVGRRSLWYISKVGWLNNPVYDGVRPTLSYPIIHPTTSYTGLSFESRAVDCLRLRMTGYDDYGRMAEQSSVGRRRVG